ncbi:GTP-binding protein (dynamin domain) [Campylobacter insulaenigrae NCTC 12927]|uniref:GTP-binding protein (Dynamin domain) n=1 Tax=Campylobacter insulaenigrae NCTC 12927 TaxID=1031564 RepID=A0A0A8H0M7_9BACT|nr:dynamin family protein [Campylobacter insulaenigrae]AJC87330.1 GTP-binding protein (dynamin domain) [Campylobacter insulaenigrae NCTC 12927]MCR6590749.1 dynamin family protein [Campylobacter insulaenigrae]MCR6592426.1 dynamin family protein [Campylobacter insulaenigrae]VEH93197.1 ATP/GTP-binding protein [Campylobacter insulaenigrae]VEJ52695.1 ATP/GTP-binding protein [Campylobacter insulaenigrae]
MSLKEINNTSPLDQGAIKTLLKQIWQNHSVFLDYECVFEDKVLDSQKIAIILSVNLQNYERFRALDEFKNIIKSLRLRLDIYNIQYAQVCFINALKLGLIDKSEILQFLELLQKITDNSAIYTFVSNIKSIKKDYKQELYNSHKNLDLINENLQQLCDDENIVKTLNEASIKFNKVDFYIAVTGVVNAGKSSMLNALLKNNFLGVSNIPETANLTILKYDKNQEATIYFWNKSEWKNILDNSKKNEDMLKLIKELKQDFNLDDYISQENKSIKIDFDSLKNYTSAKNKISALIKQIEISTLLDFLKDNVYIVDTPGLDDMIIQRELLTKNYILKADFLIHLMNVSQSLSQKDCDFIIDCLVNSRVSKLLIVLTKADLLSQADLKEVVSYTKNKLKEALLVKKLDENLILNAECICISSKLANDFYQNNGGDLEKSNVLLLEDLINKSLYDKNMIAMRAYKKELLLILESLVQKINTNNKILNFKTYELNEENEKNIAKFKKMQDNLKKIREELAQIFNHKEDEKDEVKTLLYLLAKKLQEKLIDELKYNQINKKKNDTQRLSIIIDTTLKDGIFDILREIKYQSELKLNEIQNALKLKYNFLEEILESNFIDFKNLVQEKIDNIFNNDILDNLKMNLFQDINENKDIYKLHFEEAILAKLEGLDVYNIAKNIKTNQEFSIFLKMKLAQYEKEQEDKFKDLKEMILNVENNEQKSKELLEKNEQKLQKLQKLKLDLVNAS